jgi:hypothetical protein
MAHQIGGLAGLERRLRTGRLLDKDQLLQSCRWRLPANRYLNRDRRIERAMLHALTGPGASKAERQQAVLQANCTPEVPCGLLTCWLCKHHAWLKLRRKLAAVFRHTIQPDETSWVTIIIDVCEPTPTAIQWRIDQFRAWAQHLPKAWSVALSGRFEVDLLVNPGGKTGTFKRTTLRQLGLDRDDPGPVAVLHVHLIAYHPKLVRALLQMRLKQCIPGVRRTQAKPFQHQQTQAEALDHLTRYMLKSKPPDDTLFGRGSKSCQPRDPKELRRYNKLLIALMGENGECMVR